MKKGLKNSNQKDLSKSLRKKLQTNKGKLIFGFSVVMLIVVLNMIISKTTGFNAIEKSYDYIAKAVNGQKNNKIEYTKEIKNVEIQSDGYKDNEPGSWHIDKSAEWTGLGKAKVTFNVDTIMKTLDRNKDVILVIDISGSMNGDKLAKVKEDAIDLVNILLSNQENKVALITFDAESKIVSKFTNNKEELIDKINSFIAYGTTNYNQALKNVDVVMKEYVKVDDKDVVTLFLTDGYPNEETPNQIGTYRLLKDRYPYMKINGIQYEMGKDIIDEIKEISDNQWVANQDTLDNVLFEASITPIIYEKYEVIDYIDNDYFEVVSEDDIIVSVGTVKLIRENNQQKVIWTIDSLVTGTSATMDINLIFKEEYEKVGGYYPTNEKEEITSKLPDEEEKNIESILTPVLKNQYEVIYDTNTPTGCTLTAIPNEPHFVYENVEMKRQELGCDGYIFKGWEIIDNVQKVNDDIFVMPAHNVTIRATWSKPSIDKSMKGEIWELKTIYKAIEEEANKSGSQVTKYEGKVDDTFDSNADKDVYIYTGTKNNNVIFAEKCWKIVRTTTTGGVKLLYNGVPTSSGACNATGAAATIGDSKFDSDVSSLAHVGYMYNISYKSLYGSSASGSIFSTDVIYDGENYILSGETKSGYSADTTHHYTCGTKGTTKCNTVRYYYYSQAYIELDGKAKNIEEALEQMLAQNVYNSTIKDVIDDWYRDNILYTKYKDQLEDIIFCNDRSMSNKEKNGWNPNGGKLNEYLYFKEYYISTDLTCTNETDRFSTQNAKAKLDYPIGLLSSPEAELMGKGARNIGYDYWLGSPNNFSSGNAIEHYVDKNGALSHISINYDFGVRPTVSLAPGTEYSDGDGTTTSPFMID